MIEIRKTGQEDFDRIYEIMEKSFPDDEYREYEEQRELFSRPEYSVYVVDGQSGSESLKAFSAVWEFDDFMYIEHLAVNPDNRNGGVGASILKSLQDMSDKPICLEVELPENELARRRIGFYSRNGFNLNHYPYIQPPMSAGKNPVPLLIMTTGGTILESEFANIRDVLYRNVYGCDI